ncbi:MAG: AbrB/MazE/SpoVT family DNA-binding domain-containing protein [Acidobacteriota bacterium]|nr:MAG: AbrB/MazE/SpoVT family DNA-binding domain-containing protein [Acidobacteriota bacterium]
MGATTTMTGGGRIVIPAEIRKRLGLKSGERFNVEVDADDSLRITSRTQALRRAQQLFRQQVPEGTPVVDEFIAERRKEAENE